LHLDDVQGLVQQLLLVIQVDVSRTRHLVHYVF
jgi:hypothetical protein